MSEVEHEDQPSQGIPLPIIREAHMNDLDALTLSEIDDDWTEEELEWDTLFAQPHVQAGLARLEEEAMRQFHEGKWVEGGFAVE